MNAQQTFLFLIIFTISISNGHPMSVMSWGMGSWPWQSKAKFSFRSEAGRKVTPSSITYTDPHANKKETPVQASADPYSERKLNVDEDTCMRVGMHGLRSFNAVGCAVFKAVPPCHSVVGNPALPYPQCCPQVICPSYYVSINSNGTKTPVLNIVKSKVFVKTPYSNDPWITNQKK